MEPNFQDFSSPATSGKNLPRQNLNSESVNAVPSLKKTPIITYSGKKKRRFSLRRFMIPIFSLFLAFLLLLVYTESILAPQFSGLAKSTAEKYILETVNETVGEMADKGLLSYSSMVKTIRDNNGQVIYLEVDTAMLGKAKSDLVKEINQALSEKNKLRITVPFGSLVGWNLTSGRGLPIKIKLYPLGMAEGEIYTVLEDCGINQTRHLIRVDVSAKYVVILPGENLEIETHVSLPLGERVLVGDVPEIYLDNIGGN